MGLSSQCVKLPGAQSKDQVLTFAVPQGSVLGAEFYCYYSKPVGKIIRSHSMDYHCYADDSQIYLIIKQTNISSTLHRVEQCVSDIKGWMGHNLLKLNEDKTEVILFAPESKQHLLNNISLQFGDSTISPSVKVKNLGCWWNSILSMKDNVNITAQTCYYQLRKINLIRQFLSQPALKTIIQSLVISRMDYCNVLLAGADKCVTNKLQSVQNMAARVITGQKKSDDVEYTLYELHWLPVRKRVEFKVLLLTYKALNDLAPQYLRDLLPDYTPGRPLRSQSLSLLNIPKYNTKYGKRFTYTAPDLWNKLPGNVKYADSVMSFKGLLKTHLFRSAYVGFS